MTQPQKPVYLIARNDEWLASADVANAALAFGTREAAQEYADGLAEDEDVSPDQFRVVEYTFSEATKP